MLENLTLKIALFFFRITMWKLGRFCSSEGQTNQLTINSPDFGTDGFLST